MTTTPFPASLPCSLSQPAVESAPRASAFVFDGALVGVVIGIALWVVLAVAVLTSLTGLDALLAP